MAENVGVDKLWEDNRVVRDQVTGAKAAIFGQFMLKRGRAMIKR
jgi:hypothetical protein